MLTTKQIAKMHFIKEDLVRKIISRSEFAKYRTQDYRYHINNCINFHIDFNNYLFKHYAK